MFRCARPEIVRDNLGHVEYRRDPELPATEGRNPNIHRNPALQLEPDSGLNHNLVYLFLDEVHSQDMTNGLAIRPKTENSR